MTANEYNQCVQDFSDRLYRFAISRVSDLAEAQDIVQVVFERLWKRHTEVNFDAARSYLFTSINRGCIDYYRRKKTRGTSELRQDLGMEVSGHDFETRQLIEEMLSKLSDQQRALILLRDYEGYSYKEIGEILNLTEGQVKTNIFRTRKKLQFFLTNNVV